MSNSTRNLLAGLHKSSLELTPPFSQHCSSQTIELSEGSSEVRFQFSYPQHFRSPSEENNTVFFKSKAIDPSKGAGLELRCEVKFGHKKCKPRRWKRDHQQKWEAECHNGMLTSLC